MHLIRNHITLEFAQFLSWVLFILATVNLQDKLREAGL